MRAAFDRFYGKIKPGSTALVFFSGYGIQSDRQTYVIPVNAQIWTEADVRRVFDRFYRADRARSRATGGSGLGLAILKQLVEAQGGRVWASSDGRGVTVGFSLPEAGREPSE